MIFQFGKCTIDIDVSKTRAFYERAPLNTDTCACDDCQNFDRAASLLPDPVGAFFAELGVDMRKIREVYGLCAQGKEGLLYGGFYHVCGKITSPENDAPFALAEKFQITFHTACDLLEEDFPQPAMQIDILATIPWVLEQKHSY